MVGPVSLLTLTGAVPGEEAAGAPHHTALQCGSGINLQPLGVSIQDPIQPTRFGPRIGSVGFDGWP